MDELAVKVKKLCPNAIVPQYQTAGAAGFDLCAAEDVIIEPGETKLVRTGLAFEIPQGYAMFIVPRSGISLWTKLRVANAPATVDSDYRGEVSVITENTRPWLREYVDCVTETTDGKLLVDNWTAEGEYIETVETDKEDDDYLNDGTYIIRAGDRIAQGIIQAVPRAVFSEVDELSDTDRGEGGFGSTGAGAKRSYTDRHIRKMMALKKWMGEGD